MRAGVIVRELRRQSGLSTNQLADTLREPAETVRHTLRLLMDGGVVVADTRQEGPRKVSRHRLDPTIGLLAGVEVSQDGLATAAVTNFEFSDPVTESLAVPMQQPRRALDDIAKLIARVHGRYLERQRRADGRVPPLVGVGLTLPGPIRRDPNHDSPKQAARWNRIPEAGTILPGWDDVNPAARLAEFLRTEGVEPPRTDRRRFVWIENDASAGALGVHSYMRTHHPGAEVPDDLIYIRVTWGIGCGLINKGHLLTGSRGFAGELGHVTVDAAGRLCYVCGRRGCLETIASDRAVEQQLQTVLRDVDPDKSAAPFVALLKSDHPAVDRALRDAGAHVGSAVAQICTIMNPQCIVLGGLQPSHVSLTDGHVPFRVGFEEALRTQAPRQFVAEDRLSVRTWAEIAGPERLGPELLGGLALVIDHLGDGYLLDPVKGWMDGDRTGHVDFS